MIRPSDHPKNPSEHFLEAVPEKITRAGRAEFLLCDAAETLRKETGRLESGKKMEFREIALSNWFHRVVATFQAYILPERLKLGNNFVGVHDATIQNLFSGALDKGILFDDFSRGDFRIFHLPSSWCHSIRPQACWILRGQESSRHLVVIPDPKSYLACIKRIEERIAAGDMLSENISDIICLGELIPLLYERKGLMP